MRAAVQNHAADQLHVEMPHIQNTASGFAHYGEGLFQNLVQNGVGEVQALLVELSQAVKVSVRLVGYLGKAILNSLPEVLGLAAQLLVGKLLDLRLQRIDRQDARHQPLDLAFVLGAEDLA